MNIFISGGCKNGKSYYAQRLAKEKSINNSLPLYYVATMKPVDDEDNARIKRHIMERDGFGFITIEQSENICECLYKKLENGDNVVCNGIFLLDSVTALLSNEMFKENGIIDIHAGERVNEELEQFAEITGNTVFVSDYIYSDALMYDEFTELYREKLAYIDRNLARICDNVVEVSYGAVNYIK